MTNLREDEQFVIEALCETYGGEWRVGEDPPDAYISLNQKEIAVEISILTQHIIKESGNSVPRLSQDTGVLRLCDELDNELINIIPSEKYVTLIVSAPMNKIKQTKKLFINEIKNIIKLDVPNEKILEINKNKIEIKLIAGDRPSGKKVVGIVPNANSSSDILANAQYILCERIGDKISKCANVTHRPLWLALFNDYWLADIETYKRAYDNLSIKHQFDGIYLISGDREVYKL